MFVSLSIASGEVSRGQSSGSSRPVRTFCWSIRPRDESIRIASCSAGISMLKTATDNRPCIAASSTMFIANAVFPIEGRPATMTRSPRCRPAVIASRSLNPDGTPVIGLSLPGQLVDALHHAGQHVLDRNGLAASGAAPFRDLQDSALGVVQQLARGTSLGAECRLRDLRAGPDEIAKHRALADDLRVRDDVRGVGGVLGEVREIGEPSRRVEQPVPVEPLRHGDRVARTPFVAQTRHRVEHSAMVAPVEVRRGDHVRDSIPGAVVDQDAAQYRLLGVDRVRRDAECRGAGRPAKLH